MTDFYQRYLQSNEWKHKRLLRLKIDGFKCRTCWSDKDLECHHLTYKRLGNELMTDLITLCKQCHKAVTSIIRQRRYSNREIKFNDNQERELSYVAKDRSKIDWNQPVSNAQRPTMRSHESSCNRDKEDFWQESENRSRLQRTRST